MATTTNYGWTTPNDTDLVKDGAAAIRTLGSSVDTTTKALNPSTTLGDIEYRSATANTNTRLPIGTSGQVLAVSGGGVPAWTTTADVTPLTTKGDLFTFTTVDARIGVGANNTVLTADSAEATGLKWATPASGSMTLLSTTTLSGASTTISSISGSYKNLYIEVSGFYPDASNSIRVRINGLTTGVYRDATKASQGSNLATSTLGSFALDVDSVDGAENFGYIYINNYASATNWKILDIYSVAKNNNGATYVTHYPAYVYVRETNAVSSITLFPVSGVWSGGTVRIYGVN
jgi:hypothetical protein